MNRLARIAASALIAGSMVVALAGTAGAVIATGPVESNNIAAARVSCRAGNISGAAQNVRIKIFDQSGTLLDDSGQVAVQPFSTSQRAVIIGSGDAAYCYVQGNASALRVTICVQQDPGQCPGPTCPPGAVALMCMPGF